MVRCIKKFETMDEAEKYVRNLVREDLLSIGINDWVLVNQLIRDKKHRYLISPEIEFDDVGNVIEYGMYKVYRKSKRG